MANKTQSLTQTEGMKSALPSYFGINDNLLKSFRDRNFNFSNVFEILELRASQSPKKPFLWCMDRWVTYQELNQMIETVGCNLLIQGIERGELVALHMPNCIQLFITFLALHRIGAVAVPINPTYKATEIMDVFLKIKPSIYIGLSTFYVAEFPNMLQSIKFEKIFLTNLDDLNNSTSEDAKTYTGTLESMIKYFHADAVDKFPKGCLSFKVLLNSSNMHLPDIASDSFSEDLGHIPMSYIECFLSNGQQNFIRFSNEQLIAGAIALEDYLFENREVIPLSYIAQNNIGFLASLPMVSSYGLITQLYLPLMLDGLLFFCPDVPKTNWLMNFLRLMPLPNGMIIFNSDLFFQRLYYSYTKNFLRFPFKNYISLMISCGSNLDQSFVNKCCTVWKLPLIKSIGRAEIPFVSLQRPPPLPISVTLPEQYPVKNTLVWVNTTNSKSKENTSPFEPFYNSEGSFWASNPQFSADYIIPLINKEKGLRFHNGKPWIQMELTAKLLDNKIFIPIQSEEHISYNYGIRVKTDYTEHLFGYYPDVLKAQVFTRKDLDSSKDQTSEDALRELLFHEPTDEDNRLEANIFVKDAANFSLEAFQDWFYRTISFFKIPLKCTISSIQIEEENTRQLEEEKVRQLEEEKARQLEEEKVRQLEEEKARQLEANKAKADEFLDILMETKTADLGKITEEYQTLERDIINTQFLLRANLIESSDKRKCLIFLKKYTDFIEQEEIKPKSYGKTKKTIQNRVDYLLDQLQLTEMPSDDEIETVVHEEDPFDEKLLNSTNLTHHTVVRSVNRKDEDLLKQKPPIKQKISYSKKSSAKKSSTKKTSGKKSSGKKSQRINNSDEV